MISHFSCVWLFATPSIAARQASLSITNSQSSLRFTSIESVMPSSHLILCRPLLLLPPIPPSITQSFPVSQLFAWGGQSTGVSALASFLPKNTQDWCPSEWTGWSSAKYFFSIYWMIIWHSLSCSVQFSHSVMSDSLWPRGLYSPWNSLGQNTGVDSLSLL